MNDDLDPDLKDLFAAEKDEAPPAAVRDRLARMMGTTLLQPIPPPAATPPVLAAPLAKGMVTAAKAWTMAGAAFVAGGAAVIVLTSARPLAAPPVAPVSAATASQLAAPPAERHARSAPTEIPPPAPEPPPVDAGSMAAPTHEATKDAASDISAERALLDEARTAVNAKDSQTALRILDHHARQFPRGQLWEEREALAVDALVQAHDDDQARTRAARLRERSPNSLFLPLVDAALRSIP